MKLKVIIAILILPLCLFSQIDTTYTKKIIKDINEGIESDEYAKWNQEILDGKSLDNLIQFYPNFFHSILLEGLPTLNSYEYEVLKSLSIKVVKDDEDPLSIVKVNFKDKVLIFNEYFILKLMNFTYLRLYDHYPELQRDGIFDLYSKFLYNVEPLIIAKDFACLNNSKNIALLEGIDFQVIYILFLNILFIELHELYHLCYDEDRYSLNSEISADSFAIEKIAGFVNVDLLEGASLPHHFPDSTNISTSTINEADINNFLNLAFTYDIIDNTFNIKPHVFQETLIQNAKRKLAFVQHLEKKYCTITSTPTCLLLNEIRDEILPKTKTNNNDKKELLKLIDSMPIDSFTNNDPRFYLFKSLMLLYDKRIIEAETFLDFVVAEKIIHFPDKSHEIFYAVLAHLKQYSNEFDTARKHMKKASNYSNVLSNDYYTCWLNKFDKENTISVLDLIIEKDIELKSKYDNLELDPEFEESELKIEYNYYLEKDPTLRRGIEKCEFETSDGLKNNCVFYVLYDDGYFIYEGDIYNHKPHGNGKLLYRIVQDSNIYLNYIISDFVQGMANGFTLLRNANEGTFGLALLENEIVRETLDLWSDTGKSVTFITKKETNVFLPKQPAVLTDNIDSLFMTNYGKLNSRIFSYTHKLFDAYSNIDCFKNGDFITLICNSKYLDAAEKLIDFIYTNDNSNEFEVFWSAHKDKFNDNFIYKNALKKMHKCLSN